MPMTHEKRAALVEQYARGPERIRGALEKVPPEALQWRPAPGAWSVHEIVVHCADSETNAALRIRYLLAEKEPLVVGYDQDAWARRFDYHAQPLGESLAVVAAARGRTAPLLRAMTDGCIHNDIHTKWILEGSACRQRTGRQRSPYRARSYAAIEG